MDGDEVVEPVGGEQSELGLDAVPSTRRRLPVEEDVGPGDDDLERRRVPRRRCRERLEPDRGPALLEGVGIRGLGEDQPDERPVVGATPALTAGLLTIRRSHTPDRRGIQVLASSWSHQGRWMAIRPICSRLGAITFQRGGEAAEGWGEHMRFKVRRGLRIEQIDGDVVVLDSVNAGLHRLSGDAARAVLLADADDAIPADLRTAAGELVDLGILESDGWSRRKMLIRGGAGIAVAGAGVVSMSLPAAAAAGSDNEPDLEAPFVEIGDIETEEGVTRIWYTLSRGAHDTVEFRLAGAEDYQTAPHPGPIELTGLLPGNYTVYVLAINDAGDHEDAKDFTVQAAPPAGPAARTITAVTTSDVAGNATAYVATVAFTAPDDAVTGYQYSIDNGSTWKAAASHSSGSLTTQAESSDVTLRIRAVNGTTGGVASNAAQVRRYDYSNDAQECDVPAGVTSLRLELIGGAGGAGGNGGNSGGQQQVAGGAGGWPSLTAGSLAVSSPQKLLVSVGQGGQSGGSVIATTGSQLGAGAGGNSPLEGFNGGAGGHARRNGNGNPQPGAGGGGGGATVIQGASGTPTIVAAGGGGGGGAASNASAGQAGLTTHSAGNAGTNGGIGTSTSGTNTGRGGGGGGGGVVGGSGGSTSDVANAGTIGSTSTLLGESPSAIERGTAPPSGTTSPGLRSSDGRAAIIYLVP